MISKRDSKHIYVIKFLLFLSIGLLILFALSTQYLTYQERKLADKMYPNVYLDGKNIGGKTKTDVDTIYRQKNQLINSLTVTVVYKNTPIATLSAERLNIRSNGGEIIERAYLIGRSSRTTSRISQKIATLFNLQTYQFNSKIVYDKDSLNDFTSTTEEHYNKPAKNALLSFENGRVVSFREDSRRL